MKNRNKKSGDDADNLKMQNNHERMFALLQTPHEVISHSRTKSGNDSRKKIDQRKMYIEPLNNEYADKRNYIKQPMKRTDFFRQQKYRDDRRKNRRKILQSYAAGERYVLNCQKKSKQRERPERAAQEKQKMIVAKQANVLIAKPPPTRDQRNDAAKENNFHRRNMT